MRTLFAIAFCSVLAGCEDHSMSRQKKLASYDPSSIWSDGTSARAPPAGTMARGDLALDTDAPIRRRRSRRCSPGAENATTFSARLAMA